MPIDNELPNHNADNGHAQVARTDFDNSTAALERNAEFQLSAALSAQPFPATADDALARNWPIPTRDTPLGVRPHKISLVRADLTVRFVVQGWRAEAVPAPAAAE